MRERDRERKREREKERERETWSARIKETRGLEKARKREREKEIVKYILEKDGSTHNFIHT